jgi:hypothetical protein
MLKAHCSVVGGSMCGFSEVATCLQPHHACHWCWQGPKLFNRRQQNQSLTQWETLEVPTGTPKEPICSPALQRAVLQKHPNNSSDI